MAADKERERFVKLAFCRADVLFELDARQMVAFAAGATPVLLGADPDVLQGRPFASLLSERERVRVGGLLTGLPAPGRLDDTIVYVEGAGKQALRTTMAGYRTEHGDGGYFLALKVERAAAPPKAPLPEEDKLHEKGAFGQVAAARITELQDSGGHAQVTLLKVDNLEKLLQTLGASAKRELMNAVVSLLNHLSLGGDSAGRIDGERFSVVHAETVDVDRMTAAIDAATKRFDPVGIVKCHGTTLDVDGAGLDQEQVAKALIHTMQEFCTSGAKGVRRNLSQVIAVMMADTVKAVSLIRQVTRQCDLDLHFMPICDLQLGKVHHFELLTRFRHPSCAGSPFKLITLAEEVDIIHDLDIAIVKKAIEMLKRFESREPLPPAAVNLSGRTLGNPAAVEALLGMLRSSGLRPDKLMFEITESAKVENLWQINKVMQEFRRRGFRFALDDFGAGAAGFDYLNALDADYVKFDGPVVRRACASSKGNELLSTMAKMCSQSKIYTVAEMVEDKGMANQVYYCGIDFGQGYHFGKPNADPYAFVANFVARA